MRFRFALLSTFCCVLISHAASAALLPGYATGSGANTSSLIIDFNYLGGDAYLFEYRYDGEASAQDMLLALDAAGDLSVQRQFFEFDGASSIFIDGFSYAGNTANPSFEGDAGETWTYWIVDDRVAAPTFYTPAPTGPTDRALQDGSVDAWGLNISEFNTKGLDPTFNQPAVIPEPTSLALLGLGGLAILRRRR